MADPARTLAEFQSLCDQRDLAAYRVVAAVEMALSFWEAATFAESYDTLKRARDDYYAVHERIAQFHRNRSQVLNSSGGNHDGHRTAA